jgi:Na+-transporting NADH:ubiquinone oxidoreductase subunit C
MAESRRDTPLYTILFAAVVCVACALPIAWAAVSLRPRQELNARIDRLEKVLAVAGFMEPGEALSADQVEARFRESIVPRAIDLATGEPVDSVDAGAYDQRRAMKDPARSRPAPENAARVLRVPTIGVVYEVRDGDELSQIILPIQGYGLWSTMYGYLALAGDGRTVRGITFYEHGETAGLGGEIENPRWQARWVGRQALDDVGAVQLQVIKGQAGVPADDPYRVDGLSGATITGRGVTSTLDFWLGPNAFGPYLARVRTGGN